MLCDALCKLMGDLPGENNSATLKKCSSIAPRRETWSCAAFKIAKI